MRLDEEPVLIEAVEDVCDVLCSHTLASPVPIPSMIGELHSVDHIDVVAEQLERKGGSSVAFQSAKVRVTSWLQREL